MHEASIGERNKLASLISSYCLGFSAINLILSKTLAEQGLFGEGTWTAWTVRNCTGISGTPECTLPFWPRRTWELALKGDGRICSTRSLGSGDPLCPFPRLPPSCSSPQTASRKATAQFTSGCGQ